MKGGCLMRRIPFGLRWFCPGFRSLCFILAIFIFLPLPASDAEDLLQVYQLAVDHDPQFKGTEFERLAIRQSLNQAYAKLLPVINFENDYGKERQNVLSTQNAVYRSGALTYGSTSYTLKLTQPIIRFSLFAELAQARKAVTRAEAETAAARQDLILRTAQAYLTALAAKENIAFAKAEKSDVQLMFERAKARYESGMAPVTDYDDATARLASVNAQLIKAESDYSDAIQALMEISSIVITDLKNLKEEMPMKGPEPENIDSWVTTSLERNFKLKSARYDSEIADYEISRQKAGHLPNLDLVASTDRQDSGGSLFGGGSKIGTQQAMLQITVPIFEGFGVIARTAEARERYNKALQNSEKQRRAVIRQVHASYEGILSASSRAEALKKSVDSQTVLLEAKEKGFKSGLYPVIAVMDAVRDLYMYRKDYAQSRYDYLVSGLKLKEAAGMLDQSDIAMINNWLQ